jgi:hypothetical protein
MLTMRYFGGGLLVLGLVCLPLGFCIGADIDKPPPREEVLRNKRIATVTILAGSGLAISGCIVWYLADRKKPS